VILTDSRQGAIARFSTIELANGAVESRRSGTIMRTKRKLSKVRVVGTAVTSAVFVLAIGATKFRELLQDQPEFGDTHEGARHQMGGTAMWALPPSVTPNWIFPVREPLLFLHLQLTDFSTSCTGRCTGSVRSRAPTDLRRAAFARSRSGVLRRRQDDLHQSEGLEVLERQVVDARACSSG